MALDTQEENGRSKEGGGVAKEPPLRDRAPRVLATPAALLTTLLVLQETIPGNRYPGSLSYFS